MKNPKQFLKKFDNNKLTCPECRKDFEKRLGKLFIGYYSMCIKCMEERLGEKATIVRTLKIFKIIRNQLNKGKWLN